MCVISKLFGAFFTTLFGMVNNAEIGFSHGSYTQCSLFLLQSKGDTEILRLGPKP